MLLDGPIARVARVSDCRYDDQREWGEPADSRGQTIVSFAQAIEKVPRKRHPAHPEAALEKEHRSAE